jgi:hypothetical protein
MRIHSDNTIKRQAPQVAASPPNYSSRKVQYRLLMLIFAFGATIWMMNEARKPGNWRWFAALNQEVQPAEVSETSEADPDTRISQRPQGDSDPPGIIYMDSDVNVIEVDLPQTDSRTEAHSLAAQDAWRQALESLDHHERLLFDGMMLASRGHKLLAPENSERRKEVLSKLNQQWTEYLQQAFQAVVEQRDNLTDEEKESWLTIIQQLETNWDSLLQPGLMTVSAGGELSEQEQRQLAEAQQMIDRVNLAAIVDKATTQPADAHAWYRLLEQLKYTEQEQLDTPDVPSVGFVELFDQPENYRGQLVRVAGVVKMAKRVRPPENVLGVEEYYLFWIRPDGSSSPMAIYTLELPPEFPELDFTGIELDTRASFTGFFFKRWVYAAGDGPRIAPTLLAKTATWTPEQTTEGPALPATNVLLMIIGGAAALGIAVTAIVYLTARGKSSIRSPYNTSVQQAPERLAMLEQQPAPLTTGEKLEEYMSGDSSRQGEDS